MKMLSSIVIACLLQSTALAVETNSLVISDDLLIKFAQQRTNAARITSKPARMADAIASLCRPPTMPLEEYRIAKSRVSLEKPHREKFVHVYVTQEGTNAMKTYEGVFPRGTIVLKEKFSDPKGQNTELFTGMFKREAGYHPRCGDWEFFTLSADASKVTSRGKLASCVNCHVEYRERDFVTKNYGGTGFQFGAPKK